MFLFRKWGFPSLGVVAIICAVQYAHAQGLDMGWHQHPQITDAIDEEKRVTLRGNTRPEANGESDRGKVDDDLWMGHMLLQLRRPAELERDLQQFIDELHNPNSLNFHKWLTAEEFGTRFGIARQDLDDCHRR